MLVTLSLKGQVINSIFPQNNGAINHMFLSLCLIHGAHIANIKLKNKIKTEVCFNSNYCMVCYKTKRQKACYISTTKKNFLFFFSFFFAKLIYRF